MQEGGCDGPEEKLERPSTLKCVAWIGFACDDAQDPSFNWATPTGVLPQYHRDCRRRPVVVELGGSSYIKEILLFVLEAVVSRK